jgi:hypothetical protein
MKHQNASRQSVITGWRAVAASDISTYYNGGGSAYCAGKLDFAFSVIKQGSVLTCRP